jgi:hypothetical protein
MGGREFYFAGNHHLASDFVDAGGRSRATI